jgi:hypothetical protein
MKTLLTLERNELDRPALRHFVEDPLWEIHDGEILKLQDFPAFIDRFIEYSFTYAMVKIAALSVLELLQKWLRPLFHFTDDSIYTVNINVCHSENMQEKNIAFGN